MAKKELIIAGISGEFDDRRFIRQFQERLLLLLENTGEITEKQYRLGLKLLGEIKP